jgi:hypothetical protein
MAGNVACCRPAPPRRGDGEQPPPVAWLVCRPPFAGKDRVQPGTDVGVVVEAQHLRLGQRLGQVCTVPLGEAARRDDLRGRAAGVKQFGDGLLLGGLDETAGVDEHHAGVVAVGQGPAAASSRPASSESTAARSRE